MKKINGRRRARREGRERAKKGEENETREECFEEKEILKWQATNCTTETLENF